MFTCLQLNWRCNIKEKQIHWLFDDNLGIIFYCSPLQHNYRILLFKHHCSYKCPVTFPSGERGGSVVECRTPEREVLGSRPTVAVLCPWARHFTPRKYWLITQEAMAPSQHDWKIVDWDVKPQHNQPTFPSRIDKHPPEKLNKSEIPLSYLITF